MSLEKRICRGGQSDFLHIILDGDPESWQGYLPTAPVGYQGQGSDQLCHSECQEVRGP